MNYKGFQYKGRMHRIVVRTVKEWTRGYTEPDENRYNVLQVRATGLQRIIHPWGWKDVETELIPVGIWFQKACLGSTDWLSPMINRVQTEVEQPSPNA